MTRLLHHFSKASLQQCITTARYHNSNASQQQRITTARYHDSKALRQQGITTARHENTESHTRAIRWYYMYTIWRGDTREEQKEQNIKGKHKRHQLFFKGEGIVGHPEGNQAAPPRQGDPTVR